jgi:hypothetical protein
VTDPSAVRAIFPDSANGGERLRKISLSYTTN